MDRRNQEHAFSKEEDRIQLGKFVDIPENVEISADHMCVGKLISAKLIKTSVVHSVLQHAWGRYEGVRA